MPPPPGMDPSQLESFTELLFHTPRGITGHIMLFSFFIIAVTATPIVRRRAFEVFYFCHHLFIVILVAMLIHVKLATEYFPYLGAFIIIYAVDRIYRVVRAYSSQARIHKAVPHNDGVVEVRFTAQMIQPLPGQFVRICCPSVDPLQWHPFTLTTVPGKNNTASIHFRTVGGFTREFARKLGCSSYANTVGDDADAPQFSASLDSRCSLRNDNAGQTARSLRIFVDGPYGAPTQHLFNYSVGVMIAGGIGITPFLSAMKYHLTKSIAGESTQLRRLYLIWSVRDLGALEWLGDLWEMLRVQEQQGRFADVYTVVVYYTNTKDGSNLPVKVVEDSPWGTHALDLESLSATEGPVKVPDNLPSCVQVYLYRPDYCKALRHIASQNSKTRIGVIGCGVKAMNRSVRLQLQAISGSIARDHSVHYEFRAEHF
ncbi:hypothetical protein EV182_004545 [Spiromyces aspiralis]|uniref:Uncharacterized protein n=1 Tax=Spiromyces aspiralis TaxID=68401 RepID=A0ACC1HRA8_9FUNG|nr:hypothetical protein EV182_004545 [Spiromyces aspiralis]